jgi:hypothetical protein
LGGPVVAPPSSSTGTGADDSPPAPPNADDLRLLLGGDNRRITLPDLLRLPLLSLDPQLRRLIQGGNPAPALVPVAAPAQAPKP